MYLLEHDAKELLAGFGVHVPQGHLVESAGGVDTAPFPDGPLIVKGQVAAGGRGKAGIVREAATREEARALAEAMLGRVVRGRIVEAVRVEERVPDAREIYLGLVLDAAAGAVRVIVSPRGGMDIEQVPPGEILSDLAPDDAAALAACVGRLAARLPAEMAQPVREAGERLARAFAGLEALLIEINPLLVRKDGSWAAGDAKVVTDDNALPRLPAVRGLLAARGTAYPELILKLDHGFDYVVVDAEGEIGLLTTGAGLSMMLIDELRAAGLRPYNFLDIRTGGLRGDAARLVQVLSWISEGKKVRVLLVNIFAGITDLAEFARLLLDALRQVPRVTVPVVARLVGNGLPEARAVLASASVALYTDLDEALAAVRQHLADPKTK